MTLKRRAFRLGAVAATCALAAACAPSAARVPTPSPSPTRVTPAETQVEREIRQAFEAAEKAYRANWAEVGRLSLEGGAVKPTRVLTNTSNGNYLEVQMLGLKSYKKNNEHAKRLGTVLWLRRGAYKQTELELSSCEDYRAVTVVDGVGKEVHLKTTGTRVYVQRIKVTLTQKLWKLNDFSSEQVKQCPA